MNEAKHLAFALCCFDLGQKACIALFEHSLRTAASKHCVHASPLRMQSALTVLQDSGARTELVWSLPNMGLDK